MDEEYEKKILDLENRILKIKQYFFIDNNLG